MILSFSGRHRFLSNFFPAKTSFEGQIYPTSEHAYQASKTLDPSLRESLLPLSPSQAKRTARKFQRPLNHDANRIAIMEQILYSKFTLNPTLRQLLIATNPQLLVEGNTWGDTFWGICNGRGRNNLGILLMRLRTHLESSHAHLPPPPFDPYTDRSLSPPYLGPQP